jgi:chaperonin GroES
MGSSPIVLIKLNGCNKRWLCSCLLSSRNVGSIPIARTKHSPGGGTADALVLGTSILGCAGSTPVLGTKLKGGEMSNFIPLGPRVLVRRAVEKDKTEGGIVIPDQAVEKPQQGEIVAVGPEASEVVKAGQIVLFSKYSGTEIKLNGETFLIIHFEDVLGLLTDE